MNNSNLIEVLRIEGNEVAVSRQGINNFMVNLTQMAKPYGQGKDVAHWLRLKSTQEYLRHRHKERYTYLYDESLENNPITRDKTYGGQIIVVQ